MTPRLHFALVTNLQSTDMTISIIKFASNGTSTIEEALNSIKDDVETSRVSDRFDILKASSTIVKQSRRGMANTLYWPRNLKRINDIPEQMYETIECSEDLKFPFLAYQGSTSFDGAILFQDDRYHIHPNHKTLIRRLELI